MPTWIFGTFLQLVGRNCQPRAIKMNFKINLNPYPGASYFTADEHARAFKKKPQIVEDNVELSEKLLRTLFAIPDEFRISFHELSIKKDVLDYFRNVILQDDPVEGICNSMENEDSDTHPALLDVSYSFPQPFSLIGFDGLRIDPNASLGIPTGFFILFTRAGVQLPENQFKPNLKEGFVLRYVLEDYQERGLAMLVRESNYKAAVLYQLIENNKNLESVADNKNKSKTMISMMCAFDFVSKLERLGYDLTTKNHGKKVIITVANYATHSKEMVEMFSDRIALL